MTIKRPTVAVLTGYWSTNIGNSFFQLGAEWALRQTLPGANIMLIGDQPGYWNTGKGNPANALDYVAHLDLDAVVLLGPAFRPEAEGIVGDMLARQHAKGAKIIVLAAGMMQYDEQTVECSRRMLERTPPFIFTTRDTETFELLGDIAEHACDGIDVATFVSDLFTPTTSDLPPYVAMNFDQIPEPRFAPSDPGAQGAIEIGGAWWRCEQPRWRTEMSYKSRAFLFADSFLPHGKAPEKLGDLSVVRTDHRYNPFLMRKCYRSPMTYTGDVPYSYLNIYANAECTISNRVHACVATASFGKPAMLFTRSPRAYLLKRLGLDTIREKPTKLDLAFLADEKAKLLGFLRERLAPLARNEPKTNPQAAAV